MRPVLRTKLRWIRVRRLVKKRHVTGSGLKLNQSHGMNAMKENNKTRKEVNEWKKRRSMKYGNFFFCRIGWWIDRLLSFLFHHLIIIMILLNVFVVKKSSRSRRRRLIRSTLSSITRYSWTVLENRASKNIMMTGVMMTDWLEKKT